MTKIGINGFGRVGRLVFRAIAEQGLLGKEIEVVAVNDLVPADNLAYLVKYDSTQGKFTDTVRSEKSDPALGRRRHAWSWVARGSNASPCAKAPPRSRGKNSESRS
jgi:glyceraldehyde-3-phosphate dehydrogenase/erythrose-4-phosphate dehydrogenase